jgi:hypothetical protein
MPSNGVGASLCYLNSDVMPAPRTQRGWIGCCTKSLSVGNLACTALSLNDIAGTQMAQSVYKKQE